ncbi:MAG: DUF3375 domain-containing protein, partial [Sulfobacillus thermotolerans]|nr:DUF3375 domain-containing protein [Sulfobacillus thermotolerans]
TLDALRKNNPSWKLLMADSAPLVVSFLYRAFIEPNAREVGFADMEAKLEDFLYTIRDTWGPEKYPRQAHEYLDEWADVNHGWLRKYYPPGEDEPHYDLTVSAEKAIRWLESLEGRQFVGTESRLMTVFELLRQMVSGHAPDPAQRIRELERRRAEIDQEIDQIRSGNFMLMDDLQIKDRFQQMVSTARELLSDFREVEQNFRELDRRTREQITLWEGNKAGLLEQVFGQSDAIEGSDQGRSFQAFWNFLMAPDRQAELSSLLETVFQIDAVRALQPDKRLRRIHYDWLEAGEHTQRTVALVSRQLRRFLDDQVRLENRRIMEILRQIEQKALAVADEPPRESPFMTIDEASPKVMLAMEHTLYSPPKRVVVNSEAVELGDQDIDMALLFSQIVVDRGRLEENIRQALTLRSQISLSELLTLYPLEQGLAELMTYSAIASESSEATFDESIRDIVVLEEREEAQRRTRIVRVIFSR